MEELCGSPLGNLVGVRAVRQDAWPGVSLIHTSLQRGEAVKTALIYWVGVVSPR